MTDPMTAPTGGLSERLRFYAEDFPHVGCLHEAATRIEHLEARIEAAEKVKADTLPLGTPVRRRTGSYEFNGFVVASFTNMAGELRYVVENEHERGMLHIFNGGSLVTRAASQWITAGSQP